MVDCHKCDDREVVEKDGKLYECICSFLKRIASSMAPYVRKAEILPEHLTLPIIEATDKSLYVISAWMDMKAVTKAIILKNPNQLIKITSDAEIRDVFVGSKSKASKASGFEGEVFNNLQDLMDTPDLMLVRLNEITYKNKAAAGALEEALSYRLDRDKPTWVLSNMDKPFVQGSFAYSDSVAELLSTGYVRVRIPKISNQPTIDEQLFQSPVGLDEISGSKLPGVDSKPFLGAKETKKKYVEKDESVSIDLNNSLSRYGSGIESSKKFGGNR